MCFGKFLYYFKEFYYLDFVKLKKMGSSDFMFLLALQPTTLQFYVSKFHDN